MASTTWAFTTGDFTAPVVSVIGATSTASTTSLITWTTNEVASTRIVYGPTNAYGTTTLETDTSPRVLFHSINLSNLISCSTYHYAVISADGSANVATSSDKTFVTSGCVSSTTPTAATSTTVTVSSGGSTTLVATSSSITVTTPSNFTSTSSSVVIQVQSLSGAAAINAYGNPSSVLNKVGDTVFDVKAIINSTTILDSFNSPVTITYHYSDADIAGMNEYTLWLYHYHNGAWLPLDSCSLDVVNNIITCTTPSFSIFSLFGQASSPASGVVSQTGGGSRAYGCTDPAATNYNYYTINMPSLCKYASTGSMAIGTTSVVSTVTVRDLQKGMVGADVHALQQFLVNKNTGSAAAALATNGLTNYFGLLTQAAVIEYQKANGVTPAIGYYGPKTRKVAGR